MFLILLSYIQYKDVNLLERISPQLFGYVVIAVGVLERQVKLVVTFQHIQAFLRFVFQTAQFATLTVYVHLSTQKKHCKGIQRQIHLDLLFRGLQEPPVILEQFFCAFIICWQLLCTLQKNVAALESCVVGQVIPDILIQRQTVQHMRQC